MKMSKGGNRGRRKGAGRGRPPNRVKRKHVNTCEEREVSGVDMHTVHRHTCCLGVKRLVHQLPGNDLFV